MSFEAAKKSFLRWQERTREPSLTAFLIVEVALIFVVVPLVAFGLAPLGILTIAVILFVVAGFVVAPQGRMAVIVLTASIALPAAGLLYFSFVVLTHASHVDITSLRPIVRSHVTLESVIGLLYPAVLLIRFVSLAFEYRTRRT